MSAKDVFERLSLTKAVSANLRYCLVNERKIPFKLNGEACHINNIHDFEEFEKLKSVKLEEYAGIGISIQASNICAIDVDKCFSVPNDLSTCDLRALEMLEMFQDVAYCEFSFSGRGLRILFKHPIIRDYSNKYYIKNSKNDIEYYQPFNSFRYVTLTGNVIFDNDIQEITDELLYSFLDKYMLRGQSIAAQAMTEEIETRSMNELRRQLRIHLFKNSRFQDVWFGKAPGSNSDESERDFYLLNYLFENITQDKEMLKELFESSDFFKSKDWKHSHKWTNQEFRYYNYLYNLIRSRHI